MKMYSDSLREHSQVMFVFFSSFVHAQRMEGKRMKELNYTQPNSSLFSTITINCESVIIILSFSLGSYLWISREERRNYSFNSHDLSRPLIHASSITKSYKCWLELTLWMRCKSFNIYFFNNYSFFCVWVLF